MNDNYLNMDLVHWDGTNTVIQVHAHFLDKNPNIALKCEIWDENNSLLHCFMKTVGDDCSITAAAKYPLPRDGMNLSVKAGLLWLDTGGGVSFRAIEQKGFNSPADSVPHTVSVTSPRAKNKKETWVFYSRRGECDYYYPENYLNNGRLKVLMPFSGSVTLDTDDWRVDGIADGLVPQYPAPVLTLLLNAGGSVNYERNMISQFNIDDKKVSWNFNDDWKCFFSCNKITPNSLLNFYCKFYVRLQNLENPSLFRYEEVVISSTPLAGVDCASLTVIEPIRLFLGCMASDTHVLMADGCEKMIANIQVGDVVLTDKGCADVCDVITGHEPELVHIETADGRKIRLTGGHPILTGRGYVRADGLNAEDLLILHGGAKQPLSALYMEEYGGRVYNLVTTNPGSALIGNGFLVGDLDMQNKLEALCNQPASYPAEVLSARAAFARLEVCAKTASLATIQNAFVATRKCADHYNASSDILAVQGTAIETVIALLNQG